LIRAKAKDRKLSTCGGIEERKNLFWFYFVLRMSAGKINHRENRDSFEF